MAVPRPLSDLASWQGAIVRVVGRTLSMIAECEPKHPALVFYGLRLTYAELNTRACRLANALSGLGVTKGDRVAVLLPNRSEFIEAYFASAKIGAIFVPLNCRLSAPEIGRLLDGCAATALICGDEFGETLVPLVDSGSFPRHLVRVRDSTAHAVTLKATLEYEAWIAGFSGSEPDVDVGTVDDQLIVYTSGTTGQPKGAVLTHGNTMFSTLAKIIDFGLTPNDTIVAFGPLFHVGPLMDLTIPILQRGGTVVLGRSRGFHPEQSTRHSRKRACDSREHLSGHVASRSRPFGSLALRSEQPATAAHRWGADARPVAASDL